MSSIETYRKSNDATVSHVDELPQEGTVEGSADLRRYTEVTDQEVYYRGVMRSTPLNGR